MTGRQFNKLFFHKSTLVLIPIAICIYIGFKAGIDAKLTTEDLIPHVGKIRKMELITEPDYRRRATFGDPKHTNELRLWLNADTNYFEVLNATNKALAVRLSNLKVGDSITIFTKPVNPIGLGLESRNQVEHLIEGQFIVLDYKVRQQYLQQYWIAFVIAAVVFYFYYIQVRERYFSEIYDH